MSNAIIQHRKILAVEGSDEVNFFKALLEYMEITDFEVIEVGGKDKFKDRLPALVIRTGFDEVESLAIIRDADKDASGAFESIRDVLKKTGLNPPNQVNRFSNTEPRVGIFIMPGNSDEGMLEDLCLKTVEGHPVMRCVDAFINCVLNLDIEKPNNIAKAKTQTFLAAMPKIANCVGIGAKKGYWKFCSSELSNLKSFVNNLK